MFKMGLIRINEILDKIELIPVRNIFLSLQIMF